MDPLVYISSLYEGEYTISSLIWGPSFQGRTLTKVDDSGNVIWGKVYGNDCEGVGVAGITFEETSDSGYYIVVPYDYCTDQYWNAIYRLDKTGNVIWSKVNSTTSSYFCGFSGAVYLKKDTYDDNFIVVGGERFVNCTFSNIYYLKSYINKYDSTGALIFSTQFDRLSNPLHWSYLNKCKSYYDVQGTLTEYLADGGNELNADSGLLVKINPSGNIIWSKMYNMEIEDQIKVGNSYFLLNNRSVLGSGIHKIDTSGVPFFSIRLDSVNILSIHRSDSNKVLLIGRLYNNANPVFIEMDTSCNVIQAKYIPGVSFTNSYSNPKPYYNENTGAIFLCYKATNGHDYLEKLYLNSSCNFRDTTISIHPIPLIVDSSFTFPIETRNDSISTPDVAPFSDSVTVICYQPTGVQNVPPIYSTIQIFPNPTNNLLNIQLNHSSSKKVTVSLYNLYGQILTTQKNISDREIQINLTDYPSGIYFVKVMIDGKEEIKKVVKY